MRLGLIYWGASLVCVTQNFVSIRPQLVSFVSSVAAAISVCLVWTQPDTSSPKAHNSQSHQRKNILINCRVSADSVTLKTRFTHQLLFKPDHSLSTKDGFGFMNWNTFIVRLGKQVDRQRFSSKSQKKINAEASNQLPQLSPAARENFDGLRRLIRSDQSKWTSDSDYLCARTHTHKHCMNNTLVQTCKHTHTSSERIRAWPEWSACPGTPQLTTGPIGTTDVQWMRLLIALVKPDSGCSLKRDAASFSTSTGRNLH